MEQLELKEILDSHKLWLEGNSEGVRANLLGADLRWADLRWANLEGADLQGANLQEADLQGANLQWANLRGANLQEANLQEANLLGADLRWANLRGANLQEANLLGADLRWANLQGANLRGADLPHFSISPEEGEFIAFKAGKDCILKICIKSHWKRVNSLIGRKCRAEAVHVLEINDKEGNFVQECEGRRDNDLVYKVGEDVYADKFDDDIRVECTNGIHYFMTRKEAEDWIR